MPATATVPSCLPLEPVESHLPDQQLALAAYAQYIIPNFAVQQQTQDNWCWAAVSASIGLFYQPNSGWTQCLLAGNFFNHNNCCGNPTPAVCNQPFMMETALNRVGRLASFQGSPCSFQTLMNNINAKQPIVAQIQWQAQNVGHVVAIYGFAQADYGGLYDQWVFISDPGNPGQRKLLIDQFKNHYQGAGTWIATFLTQR